MRLFLSSENLGNHPDLFLRMVGKGSLATIENAKDGEAVNERSNKAQQHLEQLSEQGFKAEEIDLRRYFGKPKDLAEKMDTFRGVFVSGGNTFVLRRAMAASGLDEVLKKRILENGLVYGGSSAGSMILAPDLKGPIWSKGDRPDIVPKGYNSKIIWQGLNLIPFYIVPHFGSSIHGDSPKELANYYKSKELRHYLLKDGQVVVVDGDKTEVLK